jgi:hypothetical protein
MKRFNDIIGMVYEMLMPNEEGENGSGVGGMSRGERTQAAIEYARRNVGKIVKVEGGLSSFEYFNPGEGGRVSSSPVSLSEAKDLRAQVLITLAMYFLGEENFMVYEGGYWTQYIIHRERFNKPGGKLRKAF